MKTTLNKKAVRGFTLVEMIGVLAVIAILAGMLIPKIFEAIRNSRINATIEAYNTARAAALENYAKYGRFANTDGSAYTGSSFDAVLMKDGRLDALVKDKIPISQVTEYDTDTNDTNPAESAVLLSVVAGKGKGGAGYDLDGDGTTDTGNATYTVEILIRSVAVKDARDLSLRLDGPGLSSTSETAADTKGRVQYSTPSSGLADVYMYIAHQ